MKNGLQATYINPLTDFGFKKLFGDENNKELLIDFLNSIIAEEGRITEINYLPTEQLGAEEEDRKAVFDIYCTNAQGEHFIVEMQNAREPHMSNWKRTSTVGYIVSKTWQRWLLDRQKCRAECLRCCLERQRLIN